MGAWPQGASEEALMPLQLAGLAAIYGQRFKARAWQPDPDIARQIEAGLSLPGHAVTEALELRKAMYAALHRLHERYDFLISPTTPTTAWTLDRIGPDRIEGRPAAPRGHAVFTPIFNHCFVPACSVPCDIDHAGLPIGLQVSGPMFADADVLALAALVELQRRINIVHNMAGIPQRRHSALQRLLHLCVDCESQAQPRAVGDAGGPI